MSERWRPILGGTYDVSSLGRFRRAKPGRCTFVGRIMAQHVDRRTGYKLVRLRKTGTRPTKTFSAHVLVALAFLGPCPRGYEVNHKDRNRANNRARNLEYVTHSDNLLHSSANLARAKGKISEDDVRRIRVRIRRGDKQVLIARDVGLHKTTISCIARRKTWRHL